LRARGSLLLVALALLAPSACRDATTELGVIVCTDWRVLVSSLLCASLSALRPHVGLPLAMPRHRTPLETSVFCLSLLLLLLALCFARELGGTHSPASRPTSGIAANASALSPKHIFSPRASLTQSPLVPTSQTNKVPPQTLCQSNRTTRMPRVVRMRLTSHPHFNPSSSVHSLAFV
jgi:hypothetical protein